MDFEKRLQQAIERGQRRHDQHAQEERQRALSGEELKQLHSSYRLKLSEHIEACVRRLPQHFPGFQFETIYGERGWGAGCSRDDLRLSKGGGRATNYSRIELTVRPYSSINVLDLAGKGTIRNKEVFTRNVYEKLEDVDIAKFLDLVDAWTLEFAELYAARGEAP